MMNGYQDKLFSGILNLFPDKIKVYQLSALRKNVPDGSSSLLHQHFTEPLSDETFEKLAVEIVGFLKNKEPEIVYNFLYRSANNAPAEAGWVLTSAKLNKSDQGLPKEIIFFSYDFDTLADIKKRLSQEFKIDPVFKVKSFKLALLTKREKEIVLLVLSGLNSQEIADAIFISLHTVNTHRRNINEKLEIKGFLELYKIAALFGLTD